MLRPSRVFDKEQIAVLAPTLAEKGDGTFKFGTVGDIKELCVPTLKKRGVKNNGECFFF
jgi:hypothetical protein